MGLKARHARRGAGLAEAPCDETRQGRTETGSVALKPGLMQADGLHPTSEAQPALVDTVWPVLTPLLQKRQKN